MKEWGPAAAPYTGARPRRVVPGVLAVCFFLSGADPMHPGAREALRDTQAPERQGGPGESR